MPQYTTIVGPLAIYSIKDKRHVNKTDRNSDYAILVLSGRFPRRKLFPDSYYISQQIHFENSIQMTISQNKELLLRLAHHFICINTHSYVFFCDERCKEPRKQRKKQNTFDGYLFIMTGKRPIKYFNSSVTNLKLEP